MIECVEHDLEFRRLPSQKRAVVKMRVVERAGTEDRAGPPVREVVRQVLERDADDLLGDEAEVVTGHHLGVIERLGERKLLVSVADAVAPDKLELLDQHAAFRVEHPLLGHDELTSISEAALPQGGGSKAGRIVGGAVRMQRAGPPRTVDPAGVHLDLSAARNGVRHRGAVEAAAQAEHEPSRPATDQLVTDSAQVAPQRAETDKRPSVRLARVRDDVDEADERALPACAPDERLLPVANAPCIDI